MLFIMIVVMIIIMVFVFVAVLVAMARQTVFSVGLLDGDQAQLLTTGWCEASVLTAALREAL